MNSICVCDDDKEIVDAISMYLEADGYKTYKCYRGKDIKKLFKKTKIDLVILDVMMPGDDGIKTTVNLRKEYNVPILMLSSKAEANDKVLGLNVGADDYMTKPFDPTELVARVKSIIRRNSVLSVSEEKTNIFRVGELMLDDDKKLVVVGDDIMSLTPTEYNILLFMIKNKGKVLSSSEIYKAIWHEEGYDIDNNIAVHIRHLREKLEPNVKDPKYIRVVWGVGYKLGN